MTNQNEQLISVQTLAKMLAASVRSIWRYKSEGRLPKAVRVGSSVKWRMSDIRLWIQWDLPSQKEFEQLKAEGRDNDSSK